MFQPGFIRRCGSIVFLFVIVFASPLVVRAQTQRGPADVVRDFYKAMRERRFRDAWAMTVYKTAVEGLTAEEMEDLRPTFEERASRIPEQVEITGEQISGNIATVFVKLPASESTPQITSQPATLINSGGVWIIGTEADEALVKKAGRRYFLDALISANQGAMEDLLKSLIGIEFIYAQQHNSTFGDLAALIKAGLMSDDVGDPKAIGYSFRIIVSSDGKSFAAAAEPARYGHTGKLSYWIDQTGNFKNADNGGKPLSPGR